VCRQTDCNTSLPLAGEVIKSVFYSGKYFVVATFMPRSSHISNSTFTRSLLLATSLAAGRRSASRKRAMAGLLLFVDSLLNRCYLLISGSVRVRRGVVGRLGLGLVLGLGLGLALGLQLGIGIGFRRNHSWSSTFTPRRNHSLCLSLLLEIRGALRQSSK